MLIAFVVVSIIAIVSVPPLFLEKGVIVKSVDKNLDVRFRIMFRMSLLLASESLVATRVLIEKIRRASETDSVPSAESLRPVNGNASGPRWPSR